MTQIIQCIPNFSEGRRPEVVEKIADAISAAGARVIDFSGDPDHNRSVITFIGDPAAIERGVIAGARQAIELIDMRAHHGEHPRVGAIDVIPLVPIAGVTMDDCARLARGVGQAIADKLQIPVYFYESSAAAAHRTNLADIRKGGYEALAAGRLVGDRAPDAGPDFVHPTAGATVVGARGQLIAFNVNLASGDLSLAKRIAAAIRRARNDGAGMDGVKALGVELSSRGIVQVTTNITEPDKTTMLDVYEFVRRQADEAGVETAESELIGVVRRRDISICTTRSIKLHGFDDTRTLDYWLDRRPA